MPTSNTRTWFITGVSTGFGRELAKAVLDRGEAVIGTVRKPEQRAEFEALAPQRARGIELDVTQAERIAPAVKEALAKAGRIDVLVNNAGYGLFGAVEETSDAEARKLMETNFFGLLNVTKAVLPHFRAQRSGHIVNFSSIAGVIGLPGCGLYCASKFAVEGLSESLAIELGPLGIKVTIVEPGGFRTNFAGTSKNFAANVVEDYAATAGKTRMLMGQYQGHEPGDPTKAAAAIVQAVDAQNPPLRLALGADAVGTVRQKTDSVLKELAAWESVSSATNFQSP